ncbi:MAG: RNA polymerase sigma factor [Novosphingobium sp.]
MSTIPSPTPLLDAFYERRAELKRYFAARVGDADADDLVQETYIKIAAITDDRDIRSPGAYIYRVGNNVMLDRLRKQRATAARENEWRRITGTLSSSGEDVFDAVPADEVLISRDNLRRLLAALEELPENVQNTFRRHKFDGLSHSEVAAEFGVSRSLVEKHMMFALKHLIRRLER